MTIYALGESEPNIDPTCFVADEATLIGKVILHAQSSVWFSAVLRGDNEPIVVGQRSNIQDGAVLHTDPGAPLTVGNDCTIGHQVMLHGCTIGDNSLVGMQAIILNHAKVGKGCLVGAGALVTAGQKFEDNTLILGSPAKAVGSVSEKHRQEIARACESYLRKLVAYRSQLRKI